MAKKEILIWFKLREAVFRDPDPSWEVGSGSRKAKCSPGGGGGWGGRTLPAFIYQFLFKYRIRFSEARSKTLAGSKKTKMPIPDYNEIPYRNMPYYPEPYRTILRGKRLLDRPLPC
jgi:hypothetical protein